MSRGERSGSNAAGVKFPLEKPATGSDSSSGGGGGGGADSQGCERASFVSGEGGRTPRVACGERRHALAGETETRIDNELRHNHC
ncbi:unnamed protein product [Merluccius merluccius]